ncbi:MAG: TonB-dependent receptor [Sulfuricurvum sp. PD_MW2]|jgi:iron complex outermembrane receptor protein|uniref:TonB-dependent receptor plug domain-containing protein n=1 Tax=Sulfuricurvum sp. PD_MW2 TaxID=2027917 RepID=UPI000C061EC7|nr:TonB-dependent receptor [Sulfuricurvum sp. PD_MW2]PHM17659.1 MAG: TonB-dependent receptor [Sulfuricurvum sp. PD_MW2]
MKKVSLLSLAAIAALAIEPVTLQKISVEGDIVNTDLSSTTLAKKQSSTMSGDVATALKDIPGVSVYEMGSRASLPVIHGMADDRVKIDIDGMTITSACPNHMNPALSYIDTTKIESINVVAGITPVSEGGDSIGGTIAVKTKDPKFADKAGEALISGEASGFYRSNNQARGASISATAANDKLSINYAGYAEQADNYKNGNGAIVRDTLYKQANHSATLAYKTFDGYIALKLAQSNTDYVGFPNEYMDMLANQSTSGNLIYKGKIGSLFIDANAYRQNTDHYMNKLIGERTGNMPMYTDAKESGLNVKATLPYSQTQTLKFGADYNRYRLNDWWPEDSVNHMAGMSPGTFLNINNGQRDRIGLFSEVVSQWSDRLSSIFGVRYDRVTMDTDDVHGYNGYSGFIGANNNDPVDAAYFNALEHKKVDNNFDITAMGKYVYSKNSDIELGFSRKTRSPNMYERYSWAGSSGVYTNPIRMDMRMVNWFGDGNGYVGNLNLDPEVANSISATLSLHDNAEKEWSLKLTPYYTKVKDYIDIDLVNTSGGINYFQFINTDAHLFGADLSGYTTLSDTVDNGKVTLKGSISYTRGFRDNGGSLYHMMPFHAKISLDRASGTWNNGIDIESVAQKSSVDTLRKEPLTPGYALVDLRTGYAYSKQLNMDFSVTNFFNKAYAMPLGGIDTVNYTANTYTPLQGMGRSFNAALSYKF